MRDLLAVAGVILLALGLGGAAAYLSVDVTLPGLELLRPPSPAVVARIQREEKRRAVQAEAGECKYCAAVAGLAKTFSRRADTARNHAITLQAALRQVSDETDLAAGRQEELKAARAAAMRAEAAAVVLTSWASRCAAEDMCKAPPVRAAKAACATAGDPRPAAALLIAMAVRKAAQTCASASCPAVDCQASAGLRSDMGQIENALDRIGGRMSVTPGQGSAVQLPVGASTLKAELQRVGDEASYVAKMLPLLLEDSKAKTFGDQQLPKLAPQMVDERAVSAAQLAGVMEQAAAVAEYAESDPRLEAAWRLKSLAENMAALGKDTQSLSGDRGPATWERVADSLGATMLDLARLQVMLDRVSKSAPATEGCDRSVASAAQQLREAAAMLDNCRMRSACVGRGGATSTVNASTGDIDATFERAKVAADALAVNEIADQPLVQVAEGAAQPSLIEALRSHGVCRRAGELREAAVAAPVATQAVADAAVPAALTPTTGILAPQDVVAGAVVAAVNQPTSADSIAPADNLVQAAARFSAATPRRKPSSSLASDPAVLQVSAPAGGDAAYQGVVLPQAGGPRPASSFGGEGGPQVLTPPKDDAQK